VGTAMAYEVSGVEIEREEGATVKSRSYGLRAAGFELPCPALARSPRPEARSGPAR
jgi:hypothetical protein